MRKQITMFVASLALLLGSGTFLPQVKANASTKETAVVIKLTLPDGTWVEARVIEDGLLKLEDEKTGQTTGFSLKVLNKSKGTVKITVLDLADGSNGSFREVESLEASFKSPKTTSVFPATTIEILAVVEQIPEKASTRGRGETVSLAPSNCCIRCEGKTLCANCYVQMSCGCCNTDLCPGSCS
ncbi:MAG TPA: hypothetical protein VGB76_13650 [Pyrinomonadaceae bacterium]|jgi:hypothetical protein